jgi:uncharacterized membrane protein YkvA (DUF1232 family)
MKAKDIKPLLKKGTAIGFALLSRRDKIDHLLSKVYDKANSRFKIEEIQNDAKLFGRMVKAYFNGEYKDLSPWIFINTFAGLSYLVFNADIIPDKIKNLGFVDDLVVLLWVLNSYSEEISKFEIWEANQKVQDLDIKIV